MSPVPLTTKRAPAVRKPSTHAVARFVTQVHPALPRPADAVHLIATPRIVIGRDPAVDITLDDDQVSRSHCALERDGDGYVASDLGSSNGTFVDGRRTESTALKPGSVLRVGDTILVYDERAPLPGLGNVRPEVGRSLGLLAAQHLADLAATTDDPILIVGPTGAGKELLAQRVHDASGRPGPLVPVNCATMNRDLLGSEMFGHVKGAFSGAQRDRPGLFVEANGGTLFLDEVAELPLDQQAALLRAVQERRIRPVGADREIDVDVRIVSATHQDLEALEASGVFRGDLYARLAGVTIELPGLAQRREEVLPLFRHFLEDAALTITADAAEALLVYGWPRNIRELRQIARRVRLFGEAVEQIDVDLLPEALTVERTTLDPRSQAPSKDDLIELLRQSDGNVAEVCRALGKHRQQVYRWLKQHKLRPEDYRSA